MAVKGITTHVLDTTRGKPAAEVPVLLEVWEERWREVGRAHTDASGRAHLVEGPLREGVWRITFDLAAWFGAQGIESFFYPQAAIVFHVRDAEPHYHVPLLLSPFGYSTYRGS